MDATAIVISQYLASLEMLKGAIVACPEAAWDAPEDRNRSWHVAYHALFFAHLYVEESWTAFVPWSRHRAGYEDFGVAEGAEPYSKEEILEYLEFCRGHVAERVARLDLEAVEGHGDNTLINLELQIYAIRHTMQHVGELLERAAARGGGEVDWVGWVHG